MALDLLVVEDDAALREVLTAHLRAEGWQVRAVEDGEAALAACAERLPSIVVLDVMLPKRSGLQVCAALRALYSPSPGVVMVTARDSELDVILGFEVGADDYVVKPFRPREVVARVRALARRVEAAPALREEPLAHGRLRIDEKARKVTVDARPLRLTPTEFELLLHLAREPARVFTRLELLEEVFGSTHEGYARNVDCHVVRLRRKLEDAGLEPSPIQTIHGSGYCFELAS